MTPAHHTSSFAELVCSNSLRGDNFNNAVGVLKNEMEKLDSVIIRFARKNSVPAGGALAVDREKFSADVTEFITNHPNIEVHYNTEIIEAKGNHQLEQANGLKTTQLVKLGHIMPKQITHLESLYLQVMSQTHHW